MLLVRSLTVVFMVGTTWLVNGLWLVRSLIVVVKLGLVWLVNSLSGPRVLDETERANNITTGGPNQAMCNGLGP